MRSVVSARGIAALDDTIMARAVVKVENALIMAE
jgi:hypothetical protein